MLYRPAPHLRMWDTWMLREGGELHLFTLTQPYAKPAWDRVCHAVTRDWIHWESRDDILLQEEADPDAWDAGVILTGATFRRRDGGYAMTYGAVRADDRTQRIGILYSDDLRRWTKSPSNPVLCPAPPWYEHSPQTTAEADVPWRDAWVSPAPGGGYEAVLCAGDLAQPKSANGCIARATSPDLEDWTLHPPLVSPGRYIDMEVPQYVEWNGFHYLLFSTSGAVRRVDVPSRAHVTGAFYLLADAREGPYRAPEENLLFGSGDRRMDCYVGHLVETDRGWFLVHHLNGYRTALAAPKQVRQEPDGRLRLERWAGLDALRGRTAVRAGDPGRPLRAGGRIALGTWTWTEDALAAEAGAPLCGWLFDAPVGDGCLSCRIDLGATDRAGLLFRMGERGEGRPAGWAVCADRKRGAVSLCRARGEARAALALEPLDTVHRAPGASCRIDIYTRASYIEIYADDRPLFLLNEAVEREDAYLPAGRAGFFAEGGRARFDRIAFDRIDRPF